jgi:hypothetical protein
MSAFAVLIDRGLILAAHAKKDIPFFREPLVYARFYQNTSWSWCHYAFSAMFNFSKLKTIQENTKKKTNSHVSYLAPIFTTWMTQVSSFIWVVLY